jgi:hypothetical protein
MTPIAGDKPACGLTVSRSWRLNRPHRNTVCQAESAISSDLVISENPDSCREQIRDPSTAENG